MGHPATGWVPVPREGVPFGCVLGSTPWGAKPEGPPAPGGPAFFGRKPEEKDQGSALDPISRPLVPTRWIWRLYASEWLQNASFRYTKTDLDRIFRENTLKSIFAKERLKAKYIPYQAPQQGNSCPPQPRPKTSKCQQAGHPTGRPRGRFQPATNQWIPPTNTGRVPGSMAGRLCPPFCGLPCCLVGGVHPFQGEGRAEYRV